VFGVNFNEERTRECTSGYLDAKYVCSGAPLLGVGVVWMIYGHADD